MHQQHELGVRLARAFHRTVTDMNKGGYDDQCSRVQVLPRSQNPGAFLQQDLNVADLSGTAIRRRIRD